MQKTVKELTRLAEIIGWTKVAENIGFTSYEYVKRISSGEQITFLLKIHDEMNDLEFFQELYVIKKVLPCKLRRKINKITKKIKPEDLSGVISVLSFAIEEYKSKCVYTQLKKYGQLLKLDIEKLGYSFQYKTSKKQEKKICSIIERQLPIELAPGVGKIRKIDYKIAFVQNKKNLIVDKDEDN